MATPTISYLNKIQELRKELHQYPEYSGREKKTAARVLQFCSAFQPDVVIERLGGNGFALVFEGALDGKTVMLRAELDALPLDEVIDIPHRSRNKDLAHKCGHDGHMAILCGVASLLQKKRPKAGRIVLLFQPAEETGKGSKAVLKDPKFQGIVPDYVFALHNLPGFPAGSVIVKNGPFAFASLGIFTRIKGESSHAAFPEHGISPLPALMELLGTLQELPKNIPNLHKDTILTITYSRLGHFVFGTSPGQAELAATIRSERNEDIEKIKDTIIPVIREIGIRYMLDTIIQWHEPFSATVNTPEAVTMIRSAARKLDFPLVERNDPFRWSEDFGEFTAKYPGAIFGLGSGENHSDLHTPHYDFPDEIIEPGIRMFYEIINQINR
ncbi:MAG: amidohydrolase [Bacteroidales bacterium]|nr:amidohydrolase [Bacteroidales bacterium]